MKLSLAIILLSLSINQSSKAESFENQKAKKELLLESKLEELVKRYSKATTKRSKEYYYRKIQQLLSKVSERELDIKKPRL